MLKVQKEAADIKSREPTLARDSVTEIQRREQSLDQEYPHRPKPLNLCHGISMLLRCLFEASAKGSTW